MKNIDSKNIMMADKIIIVEKKFSNTYTQDHLIA